MRIAPRTMLWGIAFRLHERVAGDRFDELRELCTAAGDKASLAIAMAGLVMDHLYQGRMREASQLASETWELAESVGDATLIVGLSEPLVSAKTVSAEFSDGLRWSHRVIDLPVGPWVVRDGATTSGAAWPWSAAPTPSVGFRRAIDAGGAPGSTSAGRPRVTVT